MRKAEGDAAAAVKKAEGAAAADVKKAEGAARARVKTVEGDAAARIRWSSGVQGLKAGCSLQSRGAGDGEEAGVPWHRARKVRCSTARGNSGHSSGHSGPWRDELTLFPQVGAAPCDWHAWGVQPVAQEGLDPDPKPLVWHSV